MTFYHSSLLAIASLVGAGLAQLENKIALLPSGGIEKYGPRLSTAWSRPNNVVNSTDWENIPAKRGMVPVACVGNYFPGGWVTPFRSVDMRVYDVVYNDCNRVFQLCIHKDATKSLSHQDIIRNFGQVPIGMRQYAGDLAILPNTGEPWQANHTAQQHNIGLLFREDYFASWSVIAHEMSHSIDFFRAIERNTGTQRVSNLPEWAQKIDLDGHVITDYAKQNYVEAFAEAGILAAYDLSSRGGLPAVQQNWTLARQQIEYVKGIYGTDLTVGANGCPRKIDGTGPMPKSDQAGGVADLARFESPANPYPVGLGL